MIWILWLIGAVVAFIVCIIEYIKSREHLHIIVRLPPKSDQEPYHRHVMELADLIQKIFVSIGIFCLIAAAYCGVIRGVIRGIKSDYAAVLDRPINMAFMRPSDDEIEERCNWSESKSKKARQEIAKAETKISQTGAFRMVNRQMIESEMEAIATEYQFSMSEFSDGENMVELGKALNAELVVAVDLYAFPTIKLSFMNISTLQKFTTTTKDKIDNTIKLVVESLKIPHSSDDLEGTWFYDGMKMSSIKYNINSSELITPFATQYPTTPCPKKVIRNYLKSDSQLSKTTIMGDEFELEFASNEKLASNLIYSPSDSMIRYKNGKTYSTFKAGTIRARFANGFELSNAPVFIKDNRLGILVGTSKSDGTGTAYFMMFTHE